jgi:hypothetical protein
MMNSLRKNERAEFYKPKVKKQRICYVSDNAEPKMLSCAFDNNADPRDAHVST